MQEFALMGDFIKARYTKALLVEINQGATGFIALSKSHRSVRKGDMVYMDESTDYCSYSLGEGQCMYSTALKLLKYPIFQPVASNKLFQETLGT